MIQYMNFFSQFFKNLQIAVESSSDRVERADFTGMMVPSWSFSRYDLILRGFVSDIDQNHDNLDFHRSQRLERVECTDLTELKVVSQSLFFLN